MYGQGREAGSSIADRAGIDAGDGREASDPAAGDDWDDRRALAYLRSQGYKIDRAWNFIAPAGHKPTEKEESAARYLFDEWDMGWIIETPKN